MALSCNRPSHDDVLKQGDILVKMRMVQHGPKLFIPRGKDAVEALPVPVSPKRFLASSLPGSEPDGLYPLPQGLRNVLRQREGDQRHSALGEESIPFAGWERKGIKPVSVAHSAMGIFFRTGPPCDLARPGQSCPRRRSRGLFRPGR